MTSDDWIHLFKTCFPLIKMQIPSQNDLCENHPEINILGCFDTIMKLKKRSPIKQTKMTLDFDPIEKKVSIPDYFYIDNNTPPTFDWKQYTQHLNTETLGRTVIHCNVITSTFDLMEGQFLESGLAIVADQQTHGKGRSCNKWLSPEGKLMVWNIKMIICSAFNHVTLFIAKTLPPPCFL